MPKPTTERLPWVFCFYCHSWVVGLQACDDGTLRCGDCAALLRTSREAG